MQEPASQALLELQHIRKTYPGCVANDDINMQVERGEIHALLGENGAGKSTLVKIIYGVVKADEGEIKVDGKPVNILGPAQARKLGIAMIFQHFSLFESLTVAQNIALGMDVKTDLKALSTRIEALSNQYGLPLNAERYVYTLSVGERQRIEIIRCLLQEPRLLIMDEPTSVLTPQEVEILFKTLRQLASEGVSILYISHKLNEIKALCENATILRNGKCVASVSVADNTTASLATMMMGESVVVAEHQSLNEVGETRLKLNGLCLPALDAFGVPLKNINLNVNAGEIVGIAGVAGNGQDELLKVINGELAISAAQIQLNGQNAGHWSANQKRDQGLVNVPEKRLGHSAVPIMSLIENGFLTARKRRKLSKNGFINATKGRAFANEIIKKFKVKTPNPQTAALSLSGGNLQKFVVGRELLQSPDVVVVSQPTWGVDAGAAQTIRAALRALANKGSAVLVISQDLDELMEMCDRMGAICAGELSEVYPVDQLSIEKIGLMMAGVSL